MIEIIKIEESKCELYDSEDNLIGVIDNELTFNDVRAQIKEQQLEGYYIVYKGVRKDIDKDGRIAVWEEGFFDAFQKILFRLLW